MFWLAVDWSSLIFLIFSYWTNKSEEPQYIINMCKHFHLSKDDPEFAKDNISPMWLQNIAVGWKMYLPLPVLNLMTNTSWKGCRLKKYLCKNANFSNLLENKVLVVYHLYPIDCMFKKHVLKCLTVCEFGSSSPHWCLGEFCNNKNIYQCNT